MAGFLKKKGIIPDLILTSSAVRAHEFAKVLAEEANYKSKNIHATRDLYMADDEDMLKILRKTDDKHKTVFLVGHNPDITFFANSLCSHNLDNIPTSGVFGIGFDVDKWKDIDYGTGKFLSFDYPKKFIQ